MNEAKAREAVQAIAPSAIAVLDRYASMILAGNARQNLIARSTTSALWQRHLLDSAQLLRFARPTDRTWADVGSGAGLPGMVIAIIGRFEVTLVEPRRRRAAFLESVVSELSLRNARVMACDIRQVDMRFDIVSARAVASMDALFAMALTCTHERTRFILPKGRTARDDMDSARARWQGSFHVEQSLTDPDAGVVIADSVRAK